MKSLNRRTNDMKKTMKTMMKKMTKTWIHDPPYCWRKKRRVADQRKWLAWKWLAWK